MKQISEIEDPRLVKALAHPIRINILRILEDRVASPRELAEELEASLSNVSYHVRFLLNLGVLELVKTVPRRGALEHYYQAVARLRITTQAWAEVPGIVKDAMIAATLQQIIGYVGAGRRLVASTRRTRTSVASPWFLTRVDSRSSGHCSTRR